MYQFRYEFTDGRITSYSFLTAGLPSISEGLQLLLLESDEAVARLREMLNILCSKTWSSERECSQALMRVAAGA
jgi:hypothetical protein